VTLALLFVAIMTTAAIVLSRRHIATGRADLQGARRLAVWLSVPLLVAWLARSHHSWNADSEMSLFFNGLGGTLLSGVSIFALYLALEPYVRRFWPHSLLGWSRLAAGHLRDARIGYEVFAGMAGGLALTINDLVRVNVIPWFGWPAPFAVYGRELDMLAASSDVFFRWMNWVRAGVQSGLIIVLLIVLLRLTLRRIWLAAPVAVFLISQVGRNYLGGSGPWMQIFPIVSALIVILIALRFGLFALVIAYFVWNLTYGTPLTLDVAHWSAAGSNWTLLLLLTLAAFAYYASRAGQPLFDRAVSNP
jgi:hypothetical protein